MSFFGLLRMPSLFLRPPIHIRFKSKIARTERRILEDVTFKKALALGRGRLNPNNIGDFEAEGIKKSYFKHIKKLDTHTLADGAYGVSLLARRFDRATVIQVFNKTKKTALNSIGYIKPEDFHTMLKAFTRAEIPHLKYVFKVLYARHREKVRGEEDEEVFAIGIEHLMQQLPQVDVEYSVKTLFEFTLYKRTPVELFSLAIQRIEECVPDLSTELRLEYVDRLHRYEYKNPHVYAALLVVPRSKQELSGNELSKLAGITRKLLPPEYWLSVGDAEQAGVSPLGAAIIQRVIDKEPQLTQSEMMALIKHLSHIGLNLSPLRETLSCRLRQMGIAPEWTPNDLAALVHVVAKHEMADGELGKCLLDGVVAKVHQLTAGPVVWVLSAIPKMRNTEAATVEIFCKRARELVPELHKYQVRTLLDNVSQEWPGGSELRTMLAARLKKLEKPKLEKEE